jgi:cell wall-associated NlpC family hydrolase
MINFRRYIGIPYKYKGRDFDGVDCYGLLFLIYKEELGIILPDFIYDVDWYKKNENHILNNIGTVDGTFWKKIDPPYKIFDAIIVFLASRKIANHIALYIGNNKMIHSYECTSVMTDSIDNYRIYSGIRYEG